MMLSGESCEVCARVASKYRCRCTLRYCSLDCYRRHRASLGEEHTCKPPQSRHASVDSLSSPTSKVSSAPHRDYPREDVVPPRLLEYLRSSRELRSTLQNQHLRDLLSKLASESDPARLLDRLMQEPLFIEFADACMEVIEPPEP